MKAYSGHMFVMMWLLRYGQLKFWPREWTYINDCNMYHMSVSRFLSFLPYFHGSFVNVVSFCMKIWRMWYDSIAIETTPNQTPNVWRSNSIPNRPTLFGLSNDYVFWSSIMCIYNHFFMVQWSKSQISIIWPSFQNT